MTKPHYYVIATKAKLTSNILRDLASRIDKDPNLVDELETELPFSDTAPIPIAPPITADNCDVISDNHSLTTNRPLYQVVVHNDTINNFRNVFQILRGVTCLSPDIAIRYIHEIDNMGSAVVAVEFGPICEQLKVDLEHFGLTCSIDPL